MFRLVSCLVFIMLKAEAEANVPETENPVIRLSYNYDRNENYTVWKDKPLKIIIENANARFVWCFDSYPKKKFEYFVPETEYSNNKSIILNIANVTAEMSTRWVCTVLQEYHGPQTPLIYKNRKYTGKNLHFHLHVEGARAVILTANNQILTYVSANVSDNYDGETNYTYENFVDFPMNFSCKTAEDIHTEDTLRLEYYNAEGILLFRTKPRVKHPHIFRSVLKSNNDKYYLECIRTARDPDREYRYRTTFFKSDLSADAVQHELILSVNGQKLTTSFNNDTSYDDYIFSYIDGEVLNVTCRKFKVFRSGTLTFHYDKEIVHLKSKIVRSPSEEVISLNISTSDIKNKSLICNIDNTDVQKPNARLTFLSDVPANDIRISGLPRNNILYQYTNDLDQWTIEYQYSVNDTLNISCVSNGGFHFSFPKQFQWMFGDIKTDSAAIGKPNTQIKFSEKPFTKILDATHDETKLYCIYFPKEKLYSTINKTVQIILRLKPELDLEAKRNEETSDDPHMMIVPIAVAVGVAIFIITMICLVLWRQRTKRVNLIENAYDNLSNRNDSPIPAFPSQWEANYNDSIYAKIDEGVMQENYNYSTGNDKLNSMPYKRQSNTSEHHYTEIDDHLKPTPDALAANWNTAQPSNYNKQTDTLKATGSLSSNNASYNNFSDPKQGTYDKLKHNNLPINNSYENYSNEKKPSKTKSVTFRQMSNNLRPERNYSEGNSRQDRRNNDREVKPKNDGYYANTGQDIYMQPGVMHKKHNYENHSFKNENTNNPLDSDYAEPYGELGVSCKNDFYG